MPEVARRISLGPRLVWGLLIVFTIPAVIVASVLIGSGQPIIGVGVVLLAFLFMLGVLYLAREVSVRINILREAARNIGAGDFNYRIELHTGDAFEGLAASVNQMAERLESSRKEFEEEHEKAVRAAREASTLFRVSQALVSTLDLRERLFLIAQNLAEVCETSKVLIWMIEGNHMVPSAFAGLTAEEEELFWNWKVHIEEAAPTTQEAIAKQRPVIVQDAMSGDRVPRQLAEKLDMRSVLGIPIVFEENAIGYILTYEAGRVREFAEHQISLAEAVAAQAAVAIENARAYERERRISETLQRTLLPKVPPSVGDFEIADRYAAALEEAEIGGDFYDIVELSPGRVGLVIADISGKGLSAAVHTAMVKYMLRAYALEDPDPVELVTRLNAAVYRYTGTQMFVTLFYGVLDISAKDLTYVNAGHELPLLFGEDRRMCMKLSTTGTALGILPTYNFTSDRIEFVPGDVLLLYTDGAVDARRDRKFLGVEGVETMFCNAANQDAHGIVDELDRGIREYASGVLHDDVALMVVKYRRRPGPVERITAAKPRSQQ